MKMLTFFESISEYFFYHVQCVLASFHKAHRSNICSQVLLKCNKYVWHAKYNAEKMYIYGLHRFMLHHGVKNFSIIYFDYYGDSLFIAPVYNEYALECEYP